MQEIMPFGHRDKDSEIWCWIDAEQPKTSFIHLSFENGVLQLGGTGGYDIRTGFKTKLSKNLSPDEKVHMRKTLEQGGFTVEEE